MLIPALVLLLLVAAFVYPKLDSDVYLLSVCISLSFTVIYGYIGYTMVKLSKLVLTSLQCTGRFDFIYRRQIEEQWMVLKDLDSQEVKDEARDKLIGPDTKEAGDLQV